jgi:hypothetical protein
VTVKLAAAAKASVSASQAKVDFLHAEVWVHGSVAHPLALVEAPVAVDAYALPAAQTEPPLPALPMTPATTKFIRQG